MAFFLESTSCKYIFDASEVDLRLRGAGDMMGTRQSGALQFKIADLVKRKIIAVMQVMMK